MNNSCRVLLTGGAGYIGSHAFLALRAAGFEVVIVDNFSNSNEKVISRLARLSGGAVNCIRGDVGDEGFVRSVLKSECIDAVVHFASYKAVGESVADPLKYYDNNLGGTISLLQAMNAEGVKKIVFSSSATVYGEPDSVPILETFPRRFASPYAHIKLVTEDVLTALRVADDSWSTAILRYFNPVGAHESGLIGEDPAGIPNNLMPYIAKVAVGKAKRLRIFGSDYPTPDGTGVRDYIHVMDLAEGHVCALKALVGQSCSIVANLGTGEGKSVLEVVFAFEKASGRPIPYEFVDRRPGDVPMNYADASHARRLLGWSATRSLHDMCLDTWRWQSKNVDGYDSQ